jgi:hypothetical protein
VGGLLVGAGLTLAWSRRRPAAEPETDEIASGPTSDGYAEVLAR